MSHERINGYIPPSDHERESLDAEAPFIKTDPSFDRHWFDSGHDIFFIRYLSITIITTIWPWIFFWVVWGKDGIELSSQVVKNHQKDTLYVVTVISNIIGLTAAHLFSKAVVCLAQKRVVYKDMDIADITFLTALKNHSPKLSLLRQGRPHLIIMVILYLVVFSLITPGFTTFLTPTDFSRLHNLTGSELDFGSNNPDCRTWFSNNYDAINGSSCDWRNVHNFRGFSYTACLVENQLVDVIESGRGNILSLLSGQDISITYTQLGGLRFLGSISGLLPIGPNGIPAFDTLNASSKAYFPDTTVTTTSTTLPLNSTYDYTLDLQGVSSTVSCGYTVDSPIVPHPVSGDEYSYNASCPGTSTPFGGVYLIPNSSNVLLSWTCKTSDNYTLYLSGRQNYTDSVGNITCNISAIQPTILRVMYTGQTGVFHAKPPPNSDSQNPTPVSDQLVSGMVKSIGSVVDEAQSIELNLVAESIITLGVKILKEQPYAIHDMRLYESMIKGILDYEATYIRLLYSAIVNSTTPLECMRQVNGTVNFTIFGWGRYSRNAAYLIPLTLVNLTTLTILIITMHTGSKLLPRFDPTDPESLILSHDPSGVPLLTVRSQPTNRIPWRNLVAFGKNKEGIHRLWPKHEIVSE